MSFIPLLVLLSIGGWPTTWPGFGIALALDDKVPVPVACHAVAEAAALWAPYNVSITALNPSSGPCGGSGLRRPDAVLTVRVSPPGADAVRAWSSPFGSIRFLSDTDPESTILLHYDAILTLGLRTISLSGAREGSWPGAIRDRVLGRMIGRVVAHEIGHWLLRSRNHAAAGMMSAHQTTDDLADPGRRGFALMPTDVARLRETLTSHF
jgi:hypothetical protein